VLIANSTQWHACKGRRYATERERRIKRGGLSEEGEEKNRERGASVI